MTRAISPANCWTVDPQGGLSPPIVSAPIELIHWCVLWLLHADPRLRMRVRANRERLSQLMAALDDSFRLPHRVDRAFRRVCRLTQRGSIVIQARNDLGPPPTSVVTEQAFQATLRAFGRHLGQDKAIARRRAAFFRVLRASSNEILANAGEQSVS